MKIKYIIICLLVLSMDGCNSHDDIEKILITSPDEYWVSYSQNGHGYSYYQFNNDGTFNKFFRNYKGEFGLANNDGDLVNDNLKWEASKDSILSWGAYTMDIVNINEKVVVLLYENPNTRLQSHEILVKETRDNYRFFPAYFEKKREENPERYPKPFSKH